MLAQYGQPNPSIHHGSFAFSLFSPLCSKGESVEEDTLQLANIASAYYAKTKFIRPVRLVLVGQVTFLEKDPYTVRNGGILSAL